jgi:coenzyme F420-0:L-glutamate ligase/coenzyme F420-1:gamma-L-glutamate ligase
MAASREIRVIPLPFADEIVPGDDLSEKLVTALRHHRLSIQSGDILVIKHKIVSKAEGRVVELKSVRPSRRAAAWARRYAVDARLIELALAESIRIVRKKRGVLITQTRHGLVCAHSGVDVSNVDGGLSAVLLPEEPDRSAARLRLRIKNRLEVHVAVIISDSFGRPWREGLTEAAIGVAGMKPLLDYRGERDAYGYKLHGSVEAIADELACAAGLICGKLNRTPACIVRGFKYWRGKGSARDLVRPAKHDLFR